MDQEPRHKTQDTWNMNKKQQTWNMEQETLKNHNLIPNP